MGGLVLDSHSGFFLEDGWEIVPVLQLPVSPNRRYLGWEGTLGVAWGWVGLAEGGRVILPKF